MKIKIPKNNELDFITANCEQKILLPRNSKIKIVKKYEKLFSNTIKLTSYKIKNIIKDNIKYTTTCIYEFKYEGYDNKELIISIIDKVEFSTSLRNKKRCDDGKKLFS